jgi:hypothetical protein
MSNLRFSSLIVAYDDGVSQNPSMKYVDWSRTVNPVQVSNPRSESVTIAAGQSKTIFDGTRALTIDGTTVLSLSLVDGEVDRYRLTHVSGTAPGFRTDRNLNFSGSSVNVTINANGTATFVVASGAATFTAVQVGDILWIPHDAVGQPFNEANHGEWIVLTKTSTTVVARRSGDFEAVTEGPIAISSTTHLRAYSSTGVQSGDKIDIHGGFSPSNQKTFTALDVTSSYIEFVSTVALASESNVTVGASSISCFTNSKNFLYLESDQESAVHVNGDTTDAQRVVPWLGGCVAGPGIYMRVGPTWSLEIKKLSAVPLTAVIISAE